MGHPVTNALYNHTSGVPLSQSRGISSSVRAEFDLIAAGFDLTAPLASPGFTGVPTAPTPATGDSSNSLATTAFTSASIASVNAQSATVLAVVSQAAQTLVAGGHYVLTNVAATTVTLPAAPASGDTVWVTTANGLINNVIARNGKTIMQLTEDLILNITNQTTRLRYTNSDWKLV
jgi:hypothetical protein